MRRQRHEIHLHLVSSCVMGSIRAGSRPDGADVETFGQEPRRDLYSVPDKYPGDGHPEFMGDAVHLPFVHTLPVDWFADERGQVGGNDGATPQSFDEIFMSNHVHDSLNNLRTCQGPLSGQDSRDRHHRSEQASVMAKKSERDPYAVEVGERLRAIRAVLGYDSTRQLANKFSLHEDRVGTWERGDALTPPQFIERLSKAHDGVPDWNYVYGGKMGNLPHWVVEALTKLRA